MGMGVERVSVQLQDALFEYAQNRDAESRAAIERFKKANASAFRGKIIDGRLMRETKILTYDKLSEIMRICQLRLDEAFDLVGVEVRWPGEDFERLASACDKLPSELISQVAATARELAPDWQKREEIDELLPTRRALNILRRKTSCGDRMNLEIEELRHAWDDGKFFTTIATEAMPEVAEYLQISLHWLMRLDRDILVYAKKPETEAVLDEFSFMPPDLRDRFIQAVETLSEGASYED